MYRFGTYEDILENLIPEAPMAFDLETIGLYGEIRLAQFYQSHWDKVIFIDKPNPIDLVMFMIKIKQINFVMQVGNYDISTMQTQTGGRFIPENYNDTFYLARLAYPALGSYTLDNLMGQVLGYDPYKKHNIDKKTMQKASWAPLVLPEEQLMYAAIDVYHLLDVYNDVKAMEDDMSYKLDMLNVRKALDFQNNGFAVLHDEVEKQYAANVQAIKNIDLPVNSNSWKQVRPYIGEDESDGLALAKFTLQGNTRAKDVQTTRKLIKQNSFLDKFITDDHRIYGKFAPSTRSGRYACKDMNLQQLPRKLKHCFGVKPDSGRVLLYADYAQLELRTIAAIVNERNLIELFRAGGDPHAHVAQQLFGPNWTKDQRQLVKTYNFNLLYCGGASMVQDILVLQYGLYRDLDKIKAEKAKWQRAWPAIKRWQEECIRSHRRRALKQTPMGRRYLGDRLTDHANIQNQGFGAEIAKLALHYVYDDLKANDAQLVNFIHDSYLIEMDEDETANRRVARLLAGAMQEAWYEGSKMVQVQDIPMPVSVYCGHNWGRIEAGDFLFEVSK